ncbi:MAG: class I SAM-dependent methyltransferase, partial [Candidatus Omnitrophota bacterium]
QIIETGYSVPIHHTYVISRRPLHIKEGLLFGYSGLVENPELTIEKVERKYSRDVKKTAFIFLAAIWLPIAGFLAYYHINPFLALPLFIPIFLLLNRVPQVDGAGLHRRLEKLNQVADGGIRIIARSTGESSQRDTVALGIIGLISGDTNILDTIAAAVSRFHKKHAYWGEGLCKVNARLLACALNEVLGSDVRFHVLRGESLDPRNPLKASIGEPMFKHNEHEMTYFAVSGLHIAVDVSAAMYMYRHGKVDALVIVAAGWDDLRKLAHVTFGSNSIEDWRISDTLAEGRFTTPYHEIYANGWLSLERSCDNLFARRKSNGQTTLEDFKDGGAIIGRRHHKRARDLASGAEPAMLMYVQSSCDLAPFSGRYPFAVADAIYVDRSIPSQEELAHYARALRLGLKQDDFSITEEARNEKYRIDFSYKGLDHRITYFIVKAIDNDSGTGEGPGHIRMYEQWMDSAEMRQGFDLIYEKRSCAYYSDDFSALLLARLRFGGLYAVADTSYPDVISAGIRKQFLARDNKAAVILNGRWLSDKSLSRDWLGRFRADWDAEDWELFIRKVFVKTKEPAGLEARMQRLKDWDPYGFYFKAGSGRTDGGSKSSVMIREYDPARNMWRAVRQGRQIQEYVTLSEELEYRGFEPRQGAVYVDIGAGRGTGSVYLAKRLGFRTEHMAIIDAKDYRQEKYARFFYGDALESLRMMDDNSADLVTFVTSFGVILFGDPPVRQMMVRPEALLEESKRILKPAGTLAIYDFLADLTRKGVDIADLGARCGLTVQSRSVFIEVFPYELTMFKKEQHGSGRARMDGGKKISTPESIEADIKKIVEDIYRQEEGFITLDRIGFALRQKGISLQPKAISRYLEEMRQKYYPSIGSVRAVFLHSCADPVRTKEFLSLAGHIISMPALAWILQAQIAEDTEFKTAVSAALLLRKIRVDINLFWKQWFELEYDDQEIIAELLRVGQISQAADNIGKSETMVKTRLHRRYKELTPVIFEAIQTRFRQKPRENRPTAYRIVKLLQELQRQGRTVSKSGFHDELARDYAARGETLNCCMGSTRKYLGEVLAAKDNWEKYQSVIGPKEQPIDYELLIKMLKKGEYMTVIADTLGLEVGALKKRVYRQETLRAAREKGKQKKIAVRRHKQKLASRAYRRRIAAQATRQKPAIDKAKGNNKKIAPAVPGRVNHSSIEQTKSPQYTVDDIHEAFVKLYETALKSGRAGWISGSAVIAELNEMGLGPVKYNDSFHTLFQRYLSQHQEYPQSRAISQNHKCDGGAQVYAIKYDTLNPRPAHALPILLSWERLKKFMAAANLCGLDLFNSQLVVASINYIDSSYISNLENIVNNNSIFQLYA